MTMNFKTASIIRIDEPDFGCEGREDGVKAMSRIFMESEDGEKFTVEVEEKRLWKMELDEGMMVHVVRTLDGKTIIQK